MLPLAFTSPLLLLALAALPALWWLLRLVPPRPRRVAFPPTRLLLDIDPKQETPARTPWWLLLLRLTLAALVILAAAGPLWNPPPATPQTRGPLILLIDNTWPSASSWEQRIAAATALIAEAEVTGRPVAILPTAEPTRDIGVQAPSDARDRLRALRPVPHTADRNEGLAPLARLLQSSPEASLVWLCDGTDTGDGGAFIAALAKTLDGRAMTVLSGGLPSPRALVAASNAASGLSVTVLRGMARDTSTGLVRAVDLKGLPVGEATFAFADGTRETTAAFDLPVELRNDIARLEIVGEHSSGAVQLLDERWRRRTVGIVTGTTADTAQPLLAPAFYLSRALEPFADLRTAERTAPSEAVTRFVEQGLPILMLSDVGTLTREARERLNAWLDAGGLLVRFAGPRLAANTDELVPVRLRPGGRTLGGKLSWEQPQPIGSFAKDGPFTDIGVPNDVTVTRQILAEPDALLFERTWASLADGTPLVTGARRGKGLLVLFHVSADTGWSNLPLSGSFVEMLRRVVALAGSGATADVGGTGIAGRAEGAVAPSRVLDGFGAFQPPSPNVRPLPANVRGRGNADHPPGFYGPPEGLVAINTLAPTDRIAPLDLGSLGARIEAFRMGEPIDLRMHVLSLAFLLLLLDAIIVLLLAGRLAALVSARRAALVLTVIGAGAMASMLATSADAQTPRAAPSASPQIGNDAFALRMTARTRLAYVVTGDAETDRISKAGLEGLSRVMAQRTALDSGEPAAIDPARDELAFFPLLYWPIAPTAPRPTPAALARIDAFMKNGGTIVFDTRDAFAVPPTGTSPATQALREILASLDIPALEPVPRDHVLTKTFYILRDFPGRYAGGKMWVEALPTNPDEASERPARGSDSVSPVLITSNDLAAAWASERNGDAMFPMVPGEPRQREFAFRVGVNIVMYALTGNYKADQVHVPALLERLGQ